MATALSVVNVPLRWPVEAFRTLVINIRVNNECFFYKRVNNSLFREILNKRDSELDKDFALYAKRVYEWVFLPPEAGVPITCPHNKATLELIFHQFRKAYPYSPIFALTSYDTQVPDQQVVLESLDRKRERTLEEKRKAACRVFALMYFQSTYLLYAHSDDKENVIRNINRYCYGKNKGYLCDKVEKLLNDPLDRIIQRIEVELLRLQSTLNLFKTVAEKNTVGNCVAMIGAGGTAAVLTGNPLTGIPLGICVAGVTPTVVHKAREFISNTLLKKSPPEGLTFTRLGEYVSYAFNDNSSSLNGRIPLNTRESKVYGYLQFQFAIDSEVKEVYYADFDFRQNDPISVDELWNLRENMREAIDKGLHIERVFSIIDTLKSVTIPEASVPDHNLLSELTDDFLFSLVMQYVSKEPELIRSNSKVRSFLEKYHSHFKMDWANSLDHLEEIINQLTEFREAQE